MACCNGQELRLCSLSSPGDAAAAEGGKGVRVGLDAQPEANCCTTVFCASVFSPKKEDLGQCWEGQVQL